MVKAGPEPVKCRVRFEVRDYLTRQPVAVKPTDVVLPAKGEMLLPTDLVLKDPGPYRAAIVVEEAPDSGEYTAPPAHSATLRTSSIELTSSSRVGTLPTSWTTVQPGSRDRCPTIEWSVRPHEIPRTSSASSVSVSSSAQVRPSCSRLNSSGPSINRTTSVLRKP